MKRCVVTLKPPRNICIFRRSIRKANEHHDEIFWSIDSSRIGLHSYKLNQFPYLLGDGTTEQEEKFQENVELFNERFDNMATSFSHSIPLDHIETNKLFYFLRNRTKLLCQHKVRIFIY